MDQTAHGPCEPPIIAIGASAGGISALDSFFRALGPNPHCALVVIQHLLPGQPSQLSELIGGWTSMSVRVAADGLRPERNHVYVASPDDVLTLEEGVLRTR